jgi:ssDNA thymidine ADP-ribosyltransferase, DarT
MERTALEELHYITPIANLPSIMQHGLLSHRRTQQLGAVSIALQEVQDIRAKKQVPGGRPLHEYVNLYICARNPMLYKRLNQRNHICVLSVSTDVLDLAGVVVTDMNAASNYVRFGAGPHGLEIVDGERTFAEFWTHSDPIEYYRRSAMKCAEVLVPDRVVPGLIRHAYVCNEETRQRVEAYGTGLAASVNHALFFRYG